ncbi:helix-turn-helix transcriptional regulator [Kribbella sindirgiensis]|uniref:helix-turn-helix transcriptional regulator n=1 Tax=Kribbella sindirgiensis TaxID=1124744 RepID=UPI00192D4C2B|nr:helix-turn-helix transcriptional regulator [Kribbella sindirgiensis]
MWERLCSGSLDAKELRERALTELRHAVPYDGYVWALTDPVTRVGTAPLADIPGLAWSDLPGLIRSRYLAEGTRWTDPGNPSVWRRSESVEVLTATFADRYGCWAWLDLWRSIPFTPEEQAFLASIAPPLTTALRQSQARTFAPAQPALSHERPPRSSESAGGPAVLLLGADLQVRVGTPAAREALQRLNPPDDPTVVAQAIPAAAYNLAAALIATENGVGVGPPWSRVHLGSGRWITLRAARTAPDADIAVTIEESTPAERLEVFALAHALTPREREILAELTTGADSRRIAHRLVLSEHTVNDHVKAVLAKTGAATRPMLLARVAGTG